MLKHEQLTFNFMAQRLVKLSETESKDLVEIIWENGIWKVGKLNIVSYNSCKKLFLAAKLKYVAPPQLVCQPNDSNKQQHIWLMGLRDQMGNEVYSDGEASKYNTGKLVMGKTDTGQPKQVYIELTEIDSKYRSRMGFKRAYCRCVLDILGLDEFYSEDDAKEFSKTVNKVDDISSDVIDSL